jgi:hypothetical protein
MDVEGSTHSRWDCQLLTVTLLSESAMTLGSYSGCVHSVIENGSYSWRPIARVSQMGATSGCYTAIFSQRWIIKPLLDGTQSDAVSESK